MNSNIEKILVTVIVFSFALTSVAMFVMHGGSLTEEEVIKISRSSELVRSLLEGADRYTLEVHYQNKTQSGKDYGVWNITWYIHPKDAESAFEYVVSHSINDETGEILRESSLSIR